MKPSSNTTDQVWEELTNVNRYGMYANGIFDEDDIHRILEGIQKRTLSRSDFDLLKAHNLISSTHEYPLANRGANSFPSRQQTAGQGAFFKQPSNTSTSTGTHWWSESKSTSQGRGPSMPYTPYSTPQNKADPVAQGFSWIFSTIGVYAIWNSIKKFFGGVHGTAQHAPGSQRTYLSTILTNVLLLVHAFIMFVFVLGCFYGYSSFRTWMLNVAPVWVWQYLWFSLCYLTCQYSLGWKYHYTFLLAGTVPVAIWHVDSRLFTDTTPPVLESQFSNQAFWKQYYDVLHRDHGDKEMSPLTPLVALNKLYHACNTERMNPLCKRQIERSSDVLDIHYKALKSLMLDEKITQRDYTAWVQRSKPKTYNVIAVNKTRDVFDFRTDLGILMSSRLRFGMFYESAVQGIAENTQNAFEGLELYERWLNIPAIFNAVCPNSVILRFFTFVKYGASLLKSVVHWNPQKGYQFVFSAMKDYNKVEERKIKEEATIYAYCNYDFCVDAVSLHNSAVEAERNKSVEATALGEVTQTCTKLQIDNLRKCPQAHTFCQNLIEDENAKYEGEGWCPSSCNTVHKCPAMEVEYTFEICREKYTCDQSIEFCRREHPCDHCDQSQEFCRKEHPCDDCNQTEAYFNAMYPRPPCNQTQEYCNATYPCHYCDQSESLCDAKYPCNNTQEFCLDAYPLEIIPVQYWFKKKVSEFMRVGEIMMSGTSSAVTLLLPIAMGAARVN